ncbi:uncharacterized protein LOC111360848 [Spodoptera litura]|uniref:Uncharacterized protein LOC111360848 n=1 Tax=Spodoptera litura TaxID=69820 RepID=A0A9J7ER32_SPOLT|nr:uncharacterized protein LOC111360848 [Spodoptera litura]
MYGDIERTWYNPWQWMIKPLPTYTDFLYSNPKYTNPIYTRFIHTIPIYANPIFSHFCHKDSIYTSFKNTESKYLNYIGVKALWDQDDPMYTDPVETKPTNSGPIYTNALYKHPMNTMSVYTTPVHVTAMHATPMQATRIHPKPILVRNIPCVRLRKIEEPVVQQHKTQVNGGSRWLCPGDVLTLRINRFIRRMNEPLVLGYTDQIDDYQRAFIRTIDTHFDEKGNLLTDEFRATEALLVGIGVREKPSNCGVCRRICSTVCSTCRVAYFCSASCIRYLAALHVHECSSMRNYRIQFYMEQERLRRRLRA